MLSFKKFLLQETIMTTPAILSVRGHDFLDHLMSPMVGHDESELKEEAGNQKPKTTPLTIPNLLDHDAVTEKDNPEHMNRYLRLMEHGQRIADEIGKQGPMRIKKGFQEYMDSLGIPDQQGMGHNGGPPLDDHEVEARRRVALRAALNHFEEYRNQFYGYGKKSKVLGANTKIAKNEQEGENSIGLSLAPYAMHGVPGHTNCANSTEECRNSCLGYTTGKNAMLSNINAKIALTQYLIHHPKEFAAVLHHNMISHINQTADYNNPAWHDAKIKRIEGQLKFTSLSGDKRKKLENEYLDALKAQQDQRNGKKYTAGFRMNVTSDYNINNLMGNLLKEVKKHADKKGVDMKLRDYTKNAATLNKPRPDWSFLALSHTGQNINQKGEHHAESNDREVGDALNNGHTVASIVRGDATHFYDHKTKRFYPIVDGDKDDMIENRHKEAGHLPGQNGTGIDSETRRPTGVVSALRVKGISDNVKEAAGNFENQTTNMIDPETHRPMRVVEINKPVSVRR